MSRESVTAMGRRFEQQGMTSTCRVGVYTETTDPITFVKTGAWSDVAYEGPCELRFPSEVANTVDAGTQDIASQTPLLKLPVDGSESVRTGLVVEVLTHPLDPGRVGTRMRIAGVHTQTYSVSRRMPLDLFT